MLVEALEEIDIATERFPLARVNSKWRAVTWDSFDIRNISDRVLSLCSRLNGLYDPGFSGSYVDCIRLPLMLRD
jgi:hypothetical protein